MTTARESVALAQAQVEARRALERIAAEREERERQADFDRRFRYWEPCPWAFVWQPHTPVMMTDPVILMARLQGWSV